MEAILISVAAAAAGRAGEAVVKGGTVAVRKAADLVRGRFAGTPELERAQRGDIAIEDLAEAIQAACASDEDFRERLSEAVGRRIGIAKFRNEFHENVVQADTADGLHLR